MSVELRVTNSFFKFSILFSILALVGALSACSRSKTEASVTFQIPQHFSSVHAASVRSPGATSCGARDWALCDATDISEINCFVAVLDVPEDSSVLSCTSANSTLLRGTIVSKSVMNGGTITIENVPIGSNRKIQLIGTVAADAAACSSLGEGGSKIQLASLAIPQVVATALVEIKPGINEVSMNAQLSNQPLDQCSGPYAAQAAPLPTSSKARLEFTNPPATYLLPILYFGTWAVGTNISQGAVGLMNVGSQTATSITGVLTGSTDFTFSGGFPFPGYSGYCGTSLGPGQSCIISVDLNVSSVGTHDAQISVTYDDGTGTAASTQEKLTTIGIAR